MSLADDLARIARELVPESCPRCGMPSGHGFCAACAGDFRRVEAPCRVCGLPQCRHVCPASSPGWHIAAVRAPFHYADPLASCLQRFKYARQRRLGSALGTLLADTVADLASAADALVPVPLHPRRLRYRGFNQADEIARPLARRLGLERLTAGIRRSRHTRPQTELPRAERLAALAGAFTVDADLTGLRLALVDDVVTTAATVNALAAVLLAAGAVRVEAFALARATGDGQAGRNR